MKKTFLILAVLFSFMYSANAQDVGKMWIGGSVGFSSTSVKDGGNYTSFKIMPELGYVVNEELGVGLKVGYLKTDLGTTAFDFGDGSLASGEVKGFIVSPFVRCTAVKGNLGRLFIDTGVGYVHAENKSNDVKVNAMEIGFRPGVSLNISEKIALTAKFGFIGYEQTKKESENNDYKRDISRFGFDFDLDQVLMGVIFAF